MGKLRDLQKTEHAGKTFQRMSTTENGVYQFRVALHALGTVTKANEVKTQLINDLLGLRQKILNGFSHVFI